MAASEELDRIKIPAHIRYEGVNGLRKEIIEKLEAHTPESLGQASRISGVTPAAIQLLLAQIRT